MKFKYLFLCSILLILAGSMTAIAAVDDYESLGDYTFDIPDGYNVTDKTDATVAMEADGNRTIMVYKLEAKKDFNLFKASLEQMRCNFSEEIEFQSGSFNVSEYNYTSKDLQGSLYLCDDGKGLVLVASEFPAGVNFTLEYNSTRQVVDSLE